MCAWLSRYDFRPGWNDTSGRGGVFRFVLYCLSARLYVVCVVCLFFAMSEKNSRIRWCCFFSCVFFLSRFVFFVLCFVRSFLFLKSPRPSCYLVVPVCLICSPAPGQGRRWCVRACDFPHLLARFCSCAFSCPGVLTRALCCFSCRLILCLVSPCAPIASLVRVLCGNIRCVMMSADYETQAGEENAGGVMSCFFSCSWK